ncbi:MAG: helix-turn-helix transcriptional regulator [Candidatus Competibacter denitrificans]
MNAQNIIQRLRKKGWSDNAIARAIGRPQPTVSRIGNGQTDPRESIVRELEALAARESISAGAQPTPAMGQEAAA